MNKKQVKSLAAKLALCMQGLDLYNYFDGLIGFFHKNPDEFLVRAMSLKKQISRIDIHARKELLDGVSLYYMSESKSQREVGWVDKAHCLNQFFTDETMDDCEDWATFANAISYQCNVAGKCIRMAKQFSIVADKVKPEYKERRSLLWAAEAMLYQFSDGMRDNVHTLRMVLEERNLLEEFNLWYMMGGRDQMLDTEAKSKAEDTIVGCYWLVPKMDDFFRGEMSIQETYLNPMNNIIGFPRPKYAWQRIKEQNEVKLREHCIKTLLEDMKSAWEMVQEAQGDDGKRSEGVSEAG